MEYSNITNTSIRQAKTDFILSELNTCKNYPERFWQTIKKVFPGENKTAKARIKLKDEAGKPLEKTEIPNHINDYFINIGRKIAVNTASSMIDNNQSRIKNTQDGHDYFELSLITEVEVYREIMKINMRKSSGYETMNSGTLKEALKSILPQLTQLFNLSITSTTFPDSWKKATVIPIPKVNQPKRVDEYRPISLLPLPGKILEKLVHEQVYNKLELFSNTVSTRSTPPCKPFYN